MNAVAGRRPETVKIEPFRFDQMRRGCWDIDARIRDMDINGVWASLNFPSMITGFCGRVFSQCSDPELGLAVTRAWNDWLFDEWYSPSPERITPLAIGWVAMLIDRLDNLVDRSGYGLGWDERPSEILRRNFWFCTIDDPSTIDTRRHIGVDHVMAEVDYPHGDGTWPDTQAVIARAWG